jgi:hypothetical protein
MASPATKRLKNPAANSAGMSWHDGRLWPEGTQRRQPALTVHNNQHTLGWLVRSQQAQISIAPQYIQATHKWCVANGQITIQKPLHTEQPNKGWNNVLPAQCCKATHTTTCYKNPAQTHHNRTPCFENSANTRHLPARLQTACIPFINIKIRHGRGKALKQRTAQPSRSG